MEKRVQFQVTGLSGLMLSNPQSMLDAEDEKLGKKKKLDPQKEAEKRCYRHNGHFVMPTVAFRQAILGAAKGRKFGKQFATTVVKGSCFVEDGDEWTTIFDGNGKPAKKFEIDARPVVIKGRGRVIRFRPMFRPWSALVALQLDLEMIEPEQALELLQLAGRIVGVFEYSPRCSGNLGRFTAALKE